VHLLVLEPEGRRRERSRGSFSAACFLVVSSELTSPSSSSTNFYSDGSASPDEPSDSSDYDSADDEYDEHGRLKKKHSSAVEPFSLRSSPPSSSSSSLLHLFPHSGNSRTLLKRTPTYAASFESLGRSPKQRNKMSNAVRPVSFRLVFSSNPPPSRAPSNSFFIPPIFSTAPSSKSIERPNLRHEAQEVLRGRYPKVPSWTTSTSRWSQVG